MLAVLLTLAGCTTPPLPPVDYAPLPPSHPSP